VGRVLPEQLDRAYRQGFQEGYQAWRTDDWLYNWTQRLLRNRDESLNTGLRAFAEGRYDEAADMFLLATRLDNGDPASRLYATQALFALQQYDPAVPLLRRAFELQPNLLYLRFDLRLNYNNPEDLTAQLESLKAAVADYPDWAGGYLLLGYELFHSGERNEAYKAFTRAAEIDPTDQLARRFLTVCYPVPARPAAKPAPAAPSPKAKPPPPAPKAAPAPKAQPQVPGGKGQPV
jgi:tetratricopeptide (TPR) repeat protein